VPESACRSQRVGVIVPAGRAVARRSAATGTSAAAANGRNATAANTAGYPADPIAAAITGGVAAANAFYTPDWIAMVTKRWAGPPQRQEWETPMVVESAERRLVAAE